MAAVQHVRRRIELGKAQQPCRLCGCDDVVLTRSVAVRRGLDLVNPAFRHHPRTYELCHGCGAKNLLEGRSQV